LEHRGLKKFGRRGNDASSKEMKQLHHRNCFALRHINEITQVREGELWMHLCHSQRIKKGWILYNGKGTREWVSKDDLASPTAYVESIIITAVGGP